MFTSVCGLLFGEIARGLGGERLLDLVLQAVHEFRLLVVERLPGELLEHAGGVRVIGFGDEVFGFVNQLLDLVVARGFSDFGGFSGFRGFNLGGFSYFGSFNFGSLVGFRSFGLGGFSDFGGFSGFSGFRSFNLGSLVGFRGFDLGGFSGLVSRIGGGSGGLIRVVSGRRDGFVLAATGQPEGEHGGEGEEQCFIFHNGCSNWGFRFIPGECYATGWPFSMGYNPTMHFGADRRRRVRSE